MLTWQQTKTFGVEYYFWELKTQIMTEIKKCKNKIQERVAFEMK